MGQEDADRPADVVGAISLSCCHASIANAVMFHGMVQHGFGAGIPKILMNAISMASGLPSVFPAFRGGFLRSTARRVRAITVIRVSMQMRESNR